MPGVPCLFAGDPHTGIAQAADLGYDAVELHVRDPQAVDLASLHAAAQTRGLRVSALGTGQAAVVDGLTLSADDPAVRSAAVERVTAHLRAAAACDGAMVIIGSMQGRLGRETVLRAARRQQAMLGLTVLAERAAGLGVRLLLEPLNRYETDFLNTVADGLALLDEIDRPALGLLLDSYHMNIEETDLAAAVARAGRRLGTVHLADSNRLAPGLGHSDLAGLVRALRSAGYTGPLSAEILPRPDDVTAARAFRNAAHRLRAA